MNIARTMPFGNVRNLCLLAMCALTFPLAGCGGAGASGMAALPTATPAPTAPIPAPTATIPVPTATTTATTATTTATPTATTATPVPSATPAPAESVAATPAPSATPAPVQAAANADTTDVITVAAESAINGARTDAGLPALRHSDTLAHIAQVYARRMAAENFFSHMDPQSKSVFDRAAAAGYSWHALGENLAQVHVAQGHDVAAFIVRGWMNSPEHHANIVSPDYQESGLGVAVAADGTYYFAQVFGAAN